MRTTYSNVFLFALLTQVICACSDKFVDAEPNGIIFEEDYYQNAEQAYNGLVAAYDPVGWKAVVDKTVCLNTASDDFHAGGGSAEDQGGIQAWENFTLTPTLGPQSEFWNRNYQGIFRANVMIARLPGIEMDEGLKARYLAEVKFLRGYYYFDLVRLFKRFPLILTPLEQNKLSNVQLSERAAVFTQIETDLGGAIPNLPASISSSEYGRASKAAGIALLGKVYLRQNKFTEAAAEFKKVNGNAGSTGGYGNQLLPKYEDLFDPTQEFNTESIFEINHHYTDGADWGDVPGTEGSYISQMVAPRGYVRNSDDVPDFISGWGFNTATLNLVRAFQGDPRYGVTITNVDSLEKEKLLMYAIGNQNHNTGYFLRKYAALNSDEISASGVQALNRLRNEYEIRLADTYLMEAEALIRGGGDATRAGELLDAVRARVGLPSVPATFENIIKERRLELAGEGHRWFDLIRWGSDLPAAIGTVEGLISNSGFGFDPKITDKKDSRYNENQSKKISFMLEKHQFLPIPQSELEFDDTLLEQDPAY